jgi:hypothetical protein
LRSAQRRFIASESFFLPAGVSPPRRFGAAAAVVFDAEDPLPRRSAQRRFIASESRLLPAAVSPLPRRVDAGAAALRVVAPTAALASSRSAEIARPIRSLSAFNSAMILVRSNIVSLVDSFISLVHDYSCPQVTVKATLKMNFIQRQSQVLSVSQLRSASDKAYSESGNSFVASETGRSRTTSNHR